MTQRAEVKSSAALALLLGMVLCGFVLLSVGVMCLWAWIAPATRVVEGAKRQQLTEEAARWRERQELAQAEMQRQFGAEMERQQLEMDDPGPEDGQPPKALDLEEIQKARKVADAYLEHLRAGRWQEASELLSPRLAEQSKSMGSPPYGTFLRPEWPTVMTGVRSNTRCCRLRYMYRFREKENLWSEFSMLLVPRNGTYQIEDMRDSGLDRPFSPAAASGIPNP